MSVSPLSPAGARGARGLGPVPPVEPLADAGAGDFAPVLARAVETVERYQKQGAAAVEGFLSGEDGELHTTILATQRAELAFELLLQVRSKVVQAYQEILRMPL